MFTKTLEQYHFRQFPEPNAMLAQWTHLPVSHATIHNLAAPSFFQDSHCSESVQSRYCYHLSIVSPFLFLIVSFFTGARHNFPVQNQYSQPPPPLMGVQDYPGSSLQNPNWNVAGKQNNGGRARERGGGGQQDPRVKSKRGR